MTPTPEEVVNRLRDYADPPPHDELEIYDALMLEAAAQIEILTGRLQAIVTRYEADNPASTADWHTSECDCMRCEVDRAKCALEGLPV